jgi:hypothetical protein
MKTTFLRVLEADDKAAALLAAIRDPETARGKQRFEVNPASFASVPRSPFAYWVSERLRGLFNALPPLESEGRLARQGMVTADDFRFARLSFEVPVPALCSGRWRTFAKGGAYSPYYAGLALVVTWGESQVELEAFGEIKGNAARSRQCSEHYFRPGLTWPRRTNGLSLRAIPAGCIFADKGPAAFVENDEIGELLALACITNSRAFGLLVSLQLARTELAQSYEVGLIQNTPVPQLTNVARDALARLARRAWLLKRSLDTRTETSHAFTLPALLQAPGADLAARVAAWAERVRAVETELAAIQAEIDERCFALYGIDDADRQAIGASGQCSVVSDQAEETDHRALTIDHSSANSEVEDESDDAGTAADVRTLAVDLASWGIGVALGRLDVRLATGARSLPDEPEPFDPLPICSPGMLQNAAGLPLTREEDSRHKAVGSWQYPIEIPWDGILVDDPNHPLDIEKAVLSVHWSVVSPATEHWPLTTDHWIDACEILGVKSLREYFRKPAGFFADHLKRYSKSRRQAPIYWPLSSASGSYTLWIYYHRLTDETLYTCVNGFVQPKLNELEKSISRLRDEKRIKELQAAIALQGELEDFKQELLAWAPRWKPNLNDGVIITACPLWKLFRLPKWRKDLEACWKRLEGEEYDWAHLAYSLWPDRVREKCKKDRSLAIAHGLEDICEVEPPKAKGKKGRGAKNRGGESGQMRLDEVEDAEETEA